MKTPVLLLCLISISFGFYVSQQALQTHEEILAYWTPERKASAIPKVLLRDPITGQLVNNTGLYVPPPEGTAAVPVGDYVKNPYAQVGKVFFRDPSTRTNYVCSGSAVGGNVVLTAGHCVAEGDGKVWFDNWIFEPQYYNGPAKGSFTERTKVTFPAWFNKGDIGREVAFVTVNSLEGRTLEQNVGKLGFIYNIRTSTDYWAAIGYPVPTYGGKVMINTYIKQTKTDNTVTPATRGIVSAMGGGCSGGPWVYAINIGAGNANTVNAAGGLNSYGYNGRPDLYSPNFDTAVYELFTQVNQ
eukprot:TRINITY_DN327_c0_g1_i1.p1 TRINITY_DN327_c0_g1~~TRINITY_DN327_c0_g1_i1.p1  ORF type:complete len:299 (-),score=59.75 TRINITY_DN327_c0_g1_i1:75-971(-)